MTLQETEKMTRRARLREERRYRSVSVTAELVPHLVLGHTPDAEEELVIHGLPEDAVGVGANWDTLGNRLVVFVGHESYAPVRPQDVPPRVDVEVELVPKGEADE